MGKIKLDPSKIYDRPLQDSIYTGYKLFFLVFFVNNVALNKKMIQSNAKFDEDSKSIFIVKEATLMEKLGLYICISLSHEYCDVIFSSNLRNNVAF